MQQDFDIRVISLIDQNDRRDRIKKLFENTEISWKFIDAISGKHLDNYWHHYDQAQRLKHLGYDMRNNEIACFLSHRVAWQECVNAQRPFLVVEDDITINTVFSSLDEVVQNINQLCKNLQNNFFIRTGRVVERKSYPIRQISEKIQLIRCLKDPMSTIGYLVSPDVAQKLLIHSEKFNIPADNFLWQGWVHGCHLLDIQPQIFLTDEDETPSTIGNRQKPKIKFTKKFSREWYRFAAQRNETLYQKQLLKLIHQSEK